MKKTCDAHCLHDASYVHGQRRTAICFQPLEKVDSSRLWLRADRSSKPFILGAAKVHLLNQIRTPIKKRSPKSGGGGRQVKREGGVFLCLPPIAFAFITVRVKQPHFGNIVRGCREDGCEGTQVAEQDADWKTSEPHTANHCSTQTFDDVQLEGTAKRKRETPAVFEKRSKQQTLPVCKVPQIQRQNLSGDLILNGCLPF